MDKSTPGAGRSTDRSEEMLLIKLGHVAGDIVDIKRSLETMTSSQDDSRDRLTRIEVQHDNHVQALTRAFQSLTDQEGRIKAVEVQQPLTMMVRNWTLKVILGLAVVTGAPSAVNVWVAMKNADRPVVVIDKETLERWKRSDFKETQ